MKMLDKDYFAIDLPSYSKLATFDRVGPTMFEEKEVNLSKQAIRIGSLVDDILTDSNGISDKYFVIELDKPPASLGVLIDLCIAKFKSYDQITVPKVLTLAKENKLWISTKNEIKYIDKFDVDNFWNYLKMHYESEGRDLVSFETLKLAKTMANTLKEDIDTKDAFLDGDGIEVIYQHIEFWGEEPNDAYMLFGGEPPFKGYKSKFDILRIDHNNKTLQFVDIKTMMDKVGAFERSFYMFRYYIQDAMYQAALSSLRDRKYPNYTLLNPYNIVCSSIEPEKAYKIDIDENWLIAGKEGFNLGYKNFKGYSELIIEYIWHKKSKIYNYTRAEFYGGRIKNIPFHGKLK